MDPHARLAILEHAAAELLESETNGSLTVRVTGSDDAPLVVTVLGCSVLIALGDASVFAPVRSLRRVDATGPRAIAAGCDRTLRAVHRLAPDFVPTLRFDNPTNAAGLLRRLS